MFDIQYLSNICKLQGDLKSSNNNFGNSFFRLLIVRSKAILFETLTFWNFPQKTVDNELMNFTNISASYVFLVLNVIEAAFQAYLFIIFLLYLRLIDCVILNCK